MTVNELPGWLALTCLITITFGCCCFAAAGATVLARTLRRPRPGRDARRALQDACCEPWWTSLGTDHDPTHCTRKDTTR